MSSAVVGSSSALTRSPGRRAAVLAGVTVYGLAGLILAAGCGTGSSKASAATDASYLSELHNSAPDIGSFRTDTQLIRLGHAACDGFASGASYVVLADRLALQEGSNALPSQDLGAVITSAVDNYCPKYHDRTS